MNLKTKVLKESSWALVAKVLAMIGGLFFTIFIPKFAGAEIYGSFSLITAYITLLGIFTGVQLNAAVSEDITRHKISNISHKIFWESVKLKMILTTGTSVVLLSTFYFVDNTIIKPEIEIFILLLFTMNVWGLIVSYFEYIHRLVNEAIMYIVEYMLQVGLMLFFFLENILNLHSILVAYLAGYVGSLIVGIVLLAQTSPHFLRVNWFSLDKVLAKKLLERTFYLALSSASLIILTKIDTTMLAWFLDTEKVGHYAVASDIVKGSIMISIPFILGVMPLFYESDKKAFVRKNTLILATINLVIAASILFFSGLFVDLVYGPGFDDVKKVMMILALFPLVSTLQTFSQRILILQGQQRDILWTGVLAVILNVLLNLVLIPSFGTAGAAIATIIAYGTWVIASFLLTIVKSRSEQ